MGKSLTYKLLEAHLVKGNLKPGEEIAIKIDQTLTQDATGTMCYLEFEAMGIDRVKTELSVSYVDHNMLQIDNKNPDDHLFLQTIASKYGIYFSRPGNGICHQLHLERFAVPGKTLLGSDSHTTTCGGMGMLAIGAGGLDVALAMAGQPFYLTCPKVLFVYLRGKLPPMVTAKDIVLELLRRLTVKGGAGKVIEFGGDGVKTLTATERATITNMCTETGALTGIFPSDEQTFAFLKAQKRAKSFVPLTADSDAVYDETMEIDLSTLEPLIAKPSQPDNVCPVREIEGTKVHQVCIGSCTNSSYIDLAQVAEILGTHNVHPDVSATLSPGSRQVLLMLARKKLLERFITAGFRILEAGCGPCIGMGQAPATGTVSVRSFNRNFKGRSGTEDDQVYLASPLTCLASAVFGMITDPRKLGEYEKPKLPARFIVDDRMILAPASEPEGVEIIRGPNIKPFPRPVAMGDEITTTVVLKTGDNISTDDILPSGAHILSLRSNIPAISQYAFSRLDKDFLRRVKEQDGGIIIGGINYGQGSSREHAAISLAYLKIKAVIAKSFSRIHRANLINFGILPLAFQNPADYDRIEPGDKIEIKLLHQQIRSSNQVKVFNKTRQIEFVLLHNLSEREQDIVLAGGALGTTK